MNTATELPAYDSRLLFADLDGRRRGTGQDWYQLADELYAQSAVLNRQLNDHPICGGAVSRLGNRDTTSCQYGLTMMRLLHRAPEDYLVGPVKDVGDTALPAAGADRRLRWDLSQLHAEVNQQRRVQNLTWQGLAEIIGCTANRLTNLRTARQADLGLVLRLTQWLERPAAAFIHPVRW